MRLIAIEKEKNTASIISMAHCSQGFEKEDWKNDDQRREREIASSQSIVVDSAIERIEASLLFEFYRVICFSSINSARSTINGEKKRVT